MIGAIYCDGGLGQAYDFVERLFGTDPQIVLFKCQMLGKARRFDDAKRVAVQAFEQNPTFNTATAVSMAHKRADDRDGAVIALRPEGTASLVRAYLEAGLARATPVAAGDSVILRARIMTPPARRCFSAWV